MKEYIITLREPVYNEEGDSALMIKVLDYEINSQARVVELKNMNGKMGCIPLANIAGIVESGVA